MCTCKTLVEVAAINRLEMGHCCVCVLYKSLFLIAVRDYYFQSKDKMLSSFMGVMPSYEDKQCSYGTAIDRSKLRNKFVSDQFEITSTFLRD